MEAELAAARAAAAAQIAEQRAKEAAAAEAEAEANEGGEGGSGGVSAERINRGKQALLNWCKTNTEAWPEVKWRALVWCMHTFFTAAPLSLSPLSEYLCPPPFPPRSSL